MSKIYTPLLWGMFALVGVYGRHRFTAAKQVLGLTEGPGDQRENQARALVRRFDETFKEEEISATQEFYAESGAGMGVSEFYDTWKRSRLPWPQDVKSATDRETELGSLAMASIGSIDVALGNYLVALDQSIAASTFKSGPH